MKKQKFKLLKKLAPRNKRFWLIMLACVIIIGLAVIIVLQQRQIMQLDNSNATKSLVAKVGKLIHLPDETPSVATVENAENLKKQAFFADTKDGDKVLIYASSQKAIIYREQENKLINVGPISIDTRRENSLTPQS